MLVEIKAELLIREATLEEKRELKKRLTIVNPKWTEAAQFGRRTYHIPKHIKQYKCEDGNITIPRGFLYPLIDIFGPPEKIIDKTISHPKIDIPSNIILRPLQGPWVEDILKHRQGVCVASAGFGKTICLLEVISRLGQPTLWLTDQTNLINQFIEEAEEYIEAGKIGIIGDGKEFIGDKITVGMIQTLAKRDLSEVAKLFGTVILDECHVAPTNTTLGVLVQLAPKFLYGATATPYRSDNLEILMHNAIGPTISYVDRDEIVEAGGILPASVKVCRTGITYKKWGKPEYSDVIDFLVENKDRNLEIILDILSELANGHKCIALTSRIEHGKILRNLLLDLDVDCEHIHSEQSKKVRNTKLNRFLSGETPLIVATYKLLSKGFNYKPLSRIFFTLPHKAKGIIEQAKGRVERTAEGKIDAVVYDYVDDIKMLKNQFDLRLQQYKEHNLKVTYR